ncbi:hypothetical protein K6119_15020 [Paracrocinitomix mangrovi]|uniref:hypothetical protein n=1 Tax=Paracrocinitomix mangrovi TaxID=2862509 RepID=UPI001C8E5053|nr:hypothetical protein [Paracrocinitomix mangrovi]UKN01040.1 hypothetical protein K6119_15020 [Paracrocinitomix mangrovi]
MSSKKAIYYGDHPHFKVGKSNQFYQQGYFFYNGVFYFYEEDNHENTYVVSEVAENLDDFIDYAEEADLEVPDRFWESVE